jgi:hypothetical protein
MSAIPSDSELLQWLYVARAKIIEGLAAGDDVVEYEIRNRRVRREPTQERLDTIERQIRRLEPKVNTSVNQSARNHVAVTRRYN